MKHLFYVGQNEQIILAGNMSSIFYSGNYFHDGGIIISILWIRGTQHRYEKATEGR